MIMKVLLRNGRRKLKHGISFCMLLTPLILVGTVLHSKSTIPMEIDISRVSDEDLMPFQPDVLQDFPSNSRGGYTIPHIIHQIYADYYVPHNLVKNIETFIDMNPDWAYYFWTYESGRKLVAERHPYLLNIWDNYLKPKSRANALKYIVLYEFGGFYADLDVKCLRPLERATTKFSCIFPPEPFEHSVFTNGIPYLIGNNIILCRQGHPFLKQMIEDLKRSAVLADQVDVTGSSFVTYNFLEYNNISLTKIFKIDTNVQTNLPYFYKGERFKNEDDINAVYIPNTVYFTDKLKNKQKYLNLCQNIQNKTILYRRVCYHLFRRRNDRFQSPYTFTEPLWKDIYERTQCRYIGFYSCTHISRIVPTYIEIW